MKVVLSLILIVTATTSVISQIEFEENIVIDETNLMRAVKSVFTADLDGDGDMDLLAASHEDEKLSWFENLDGLGTYGNQQVFDTILIGARSISAADLDGDGDLDVIASAYINSSNNKITWYENLDGLGNFGTRQVISILPDGTEFVTAADLDGDNDMDIIAAARTADHISWFENVDGLGGFGTQQIISNQTDNARVVFIADIDGDNDNDVVSASYNDDKIAWYENLNGLGTFGSQNIITTNANGAISVFVVDIDNDGDVDVVSASNLDDKIAWYENLDGFGNFGSEIIVSNNYEGVNSVYAIDIDNDNDIDIVGSSNLNHTLKWFEHRIENNEIIFDNSYPINQTGDAVNAIKISDLDGDGDNDIVAVSEFNDYITWYPNSNASGTFDRQNIISIGAFSPYSTASADLNGDSTMDIVSANRLDHRILWYENTNEGEIFTPHFVATDIDEVVAVVAGDIDNDGDIDIASGSLNDTFIAWYENLDGIGGFQTHIINTVDEGSTRSTALADLDDDDDLDLVAPVGNRLYWFENLDGQGNFSEKILIDTQINASSIYVGDIDGDNDNDIVTGSQVEDEVFWYENLDNSNSFSQKTILLNFPSESVVATDLDGDNDLDVLSVANSSGNNDDVVWFENLDGEGNFGDEQIISTLVNYPSRAIGADLDLDGDIDVVSTSEIDFKLAWYENLGLGDFGNQQVIANDQEPRFIQAAMVDSNDSLDIITCFLSDNTIVWYRNSTVLSVAQPVLNEITLYPNPVSDRIVINHTSDIEIISVFNSLGQIIKTVNNRNYVDLGSLSPGIYILVIFDINEVYFVKKIIKK